MTAQSDALLANEARRRIIMTFVPTYEIRKKKDYLLHRIIGRLLRRTHNTTYMNVWTTLDDKSYRPDESFSDDWETIFHEGRHAHRAQQISWPVLAYIYLPSLWIVPVLLGIFCSPWWLLGIPLAWLPIPDYSRMQIEFEAYMVNLAIKYWLGLTPIELNYYIEKLVDRFCGSGYYWMWPFRNDMRRRFREGLEKVKAGELDSYQKMVQVFMLERSI